MKTKREAADYLGISVRTLERYTQKRQIPYRFEQGRRRPRVVFDDEALDAFRSRLGEQRAARGAVIVSSDAMQRVGFRLDPSYLHRLVEEASAQRMSPGDYARQLVVGGLDDFRRQEVRAAQDALHEEASRMRDEMRNLSAEVARTSTSALQAEVRQMRAELIRAVQLIMLNVFEDRTEEEVQQWVKAAFSAAAPGRR